MDKLGTKNEHHYFACNSPSFVYVATFQFAILTLQKRTSKYCAYNVSSSLKMTLCLDTH